MSKKQSVFEIIRYREEESYYCQKQGHFMLKTGSCNVQKQVLLK